MKINAKQAPKLLRDIMKAGLVPMLKGSPGVSKSALYHQLAEEYGLKLIDVRLSQCDPSDLLGFPSKNAEGTKSGYLPMNTFPIEGDAIPAGYNGWLLLLDEFNSAPVSVEAAAYKIILDRQIGEFDLHNKVAIGCAGNLASDKAIVNRQSTAMQSRLIHLEMIPHLLAWVEWANANDIDHRIVTYIQSKPEMLHAFKPNHTDNTYPCPRTWEFLSKLLKVIEHITLDNLPAVAGTIGEGAAREFHSYCQIEDNLPKIPDIIRAPDLVAVPDEPSVKFFVTGMIMHHINQNNGDALMTYLNRFPIEFQIIAIRAIGKRNRSLITTVPAIKTWVKGNSDELIEL